METNNTPAQIETYKRDLELHRQRLAQAQAVAEREQQYCSHLQGLIELEAQGTFPFPNKPPVEPDERARQSISVIHTPPLAPLKRQPAFETMIIVDAVTKVLENVDKLHADEITRQLFVIDSPQQFSRAKNQVVSEIVRKEKQGHFVRTAPNEFALPKKTAPLSVNGTGGAEKSDAS